MKKIVAYSAIALFILQLILTLSWILDIIYDTTHYDFKIYLLASLLVFVGLTFGINGVKNIVSNFPLSANKN